MAGKCIFCIFSWGGFHHPHSASSLFSILKSAESAEGPLSVSWNCLPVCPMVAFASYWSFYWSPSQCWFFKIAMLLISKLISCFRHVTWIGTEDVKIIFSLPLVEVTKVFFQAAGHRREDSGGWGHLKIYNTDEARGFPRLRSFEILKHRRDERIRAAEVIWKSLSKTPRDERIPAAEVIWNSKTPSRREDSGGWGHLKF